MATIAATHTVVKSRPADRLFGAGILAFVPFAVVAPGFSEPDESDRDWWARESNRLPEPMERSWEAKFEAAVMSGEACCRCGLPPEGRDPLRGGHCESCRMEILESEHFDRLAMAARAIEESPAEAAISCGGRGTAAGAVEPDTGLCHACDTIASEMSFGGNGGY